MRRSAFGILSVLALATTHADNSTPTPLPEGKITRYDDALDAVVPRDAKIEKLAQGFTWAEGPVWMPQGEYLLFTDVPENTLYRWSKRDGLSVFLKPSGYDGPDKGVLREPGANGLFRDRNGSVLLADSGTRVLARLDPATKRKTTVAERFNGKRFNSPNDVVMRSDGVIFFTDPPYGLKGLNDSPAKELKLNGVYSVAADGTVTLIEDTLTFPNGIALSPDERTLYVANSDPARPIWMAYKLNDKGHVTGKRLFADAVDLVAAQSPGLPDGMKVAANGYIFATAPGGVLILSPDGKRLGRIETGSAIANCAFGDDGRTLYLTSDHMLARVRVSVAGLGFGK